MSTLRGRIAVVAGATRRVEGDAVKRLSLVCLAAAACGGPSSTTKPEARSCADALREDHAIDVSPEPRVCEALAAAIAPLSPASREQVHGLKIVRDARGPCADFCPDVATALMSDAALAFYAVAFHELHVVDATFDGPSWRGGTPAPEAIAAYLAGLGLPDWDALVDRVRALGGVTLPDDVPYGSPLVLDAIVRAGPPTLLGGDIPLADLIRHELGHAVLLRADGAADRVRAWASLSAWTERDGSAADGQFEGGYLGEQPIVASRLLLGLPRGDDTSYLLGRTDTPTGYAAFDPMEDHAESFRLVHADPVALGQASPARLLVLAPGVIDLREARFESFIAPGVEALRAPGVDPAIAEPAMRALEGR